jgi:hypothetical protein
MMPNLPLPAEMLDQLSTTYTTHEMRSGTAASSPNRGSRASGHTFSADTRFQTTENLRSWKETFPDPSASPVRYAKTLFVGCTPFVTAADAGEGGWIRSFSRVVQLELYRHGLLTESIFVPFYRLPPATKSLRVTAPALMSSRIFDLILSFPLLEDLAVRTYFGSTVDSGDGVIDCRPTPGPTRVYWVSRALSEGRNEIFHPSIVVPSGRHSLPEAQSDMAW